MDETTAALGKSTDFFLSLIGLGSKNEDEKKEKEKPADAWEEDSDIEVPTDFDGSPCIRLDDPAPENDPDNHIYPGTKENNPPGVEDLA